MFQVTLIQNQEKHYFLIRSGPGSFVTEHEINPNKIHLDEQGLISYDMGPSLNNVLLKCMPDTNLYNLLLEIRGKTNQEVKALNNLLRG